MASTRTNAWIALGIAVLSGAAVLLQVLENNRLKALARELKAEDAAAVDALAAERKSAKQMEESAALLAKIAATAAFQARHPQPDFTDSPGYQVAALELRPGLYRDYAALFRRLHLSAEAQDELGNLIVEKQFVEDTITAGFLKGQYTGLSPNDQGALKVLLAAGTSDIDEQIQQDIGAGNVAQYQQYASTINYRNLVDDFAGQLLHTSSPLTDSQADSLTAILASAQTDTTPMSDSVASAVAAVVDPSQAPEVKTFIAALQARYAILAANGAALAAGKPPLPVRLMNQGVLLHLSP